MIQATDALKLLKEGNERYVSGAPRANKPVSQTERVQLMAGQEPFAVVLGCSDSRVPVEQIFDQGLGELFVVRVAGNVAGPSEVGSVEYGAIHLETKLVVVLGHTGCGAVGATLKSLGNPAEDPTPGIDSIIQRIQPSVAALVPADFDDDWSELYQQAVHENVKASVRALARESSALRRLMDEDGLMLAGAVYSMETGVVQFLDGA